MRFQSAVLFVPAVLICAGVSARAEDLSLTDVQLLYATRAKSDPVNGTGTSDEKLATVRFEHFGTFERGDNYFSLDLFRGDEVGGAGAGSGGANARTQSFFVWMPRLSMAKVTGKPLQWGPLQDVGLAARFEIASYGDYRASAPGLSLTWKLPGLAYLETALYARKTNFSSSHPLLRVVYIAPFEAAGRKFSADGLLLVSRPDKLGTNVLFQPELRMSLDAAGKVDAGLRIEHARYRFAGSSYSRTTPSVMLRWNW